MSEHEKIREIAKLSLHYHKRIILLEYCNKQEKKDKLLELYKKGWESAFISDEDMEEIQAIEEEMK